MYNKEQGFINCRVGSLRNFFHFFGLTLAHSCSLWLTLATPLSIMLTFGLSDSLVLSLAHSGSLSGLIFHSCALWLPVTQSGSLRRLAHKVLDRLATPLLHCPSLSSPDKDLEKFPNKVTFLSRCIVQLLLFVIFSMFFAFPAIRKYQEKEVGTNNLTFRFQRILTYFSKPSYGDVLCP